MMTKDISLIFMSECVPTLGGNKKAAGFVV